MSKPEHDNQSSDQRLTRLTKEIQKNSELLKKLNEDFSPACAMV